MFCTKCGKEIPDDSVFCPSCGNSIKHNRENPIGSKRVSPKKRFLLLGIALSAVAIILLGVVVIGGGIQSNKRVLKAYKEYYQDFYDENRGNLDMGEAKSYDCAGKIIMGADKKLMMTILDVTYAEEDEKRENLYLYSYERGKVVKKAELRNIDIDMENTYIAVIDNNLYFTYDNRKVYIFDEEYGEFEEVDWKLKDGVRKKDVNSPADYETEQGITYTRLTNLLGFNAGADFYKINTVVSAAGADFEYIIDNMMEKKIKTQLDMQLFYGKILQKLNLIEFDSEYPIVAVEESKYGYYGIRTSGNAILLSAKNKKELTDVKSALAEVNGHKITRIGREAFRGFEKLETVEIPENITSIGNYAFAGCSNLKEVKIEDNVKKIGKYVFEECPKLEKAEIPDGVEEIGEYLFGDYEEDICPVVVVCNNGTIIQNYVKNNNIYYINYSNGKDVSAEIEEIKKEISWKKAYIRFMETYDDEDIYSFGLEDVNQDNVPELFLQYPYTYGEMMFYINGDGNAVLSNANENVGGVAGYDKETGLVWKVTGHGEITESLCKYNNDSGRFEVVYTGHYGVSGPDSPEVMDFNGVSYNSYLEYNQAFNAIFNKETADEVSYSKYSESSLLARIISY